MIYSIYTFKLCQVDGIIATIGEIFNFLLRILAKRLIIDFAILLTVRVSLYEYSFFIFCAKVYGLYVLRSCNNLVKGLPGESDSSPTAILISSDARS